MEVNKTREEKLKENKDMMFSIKFKIQVNRSDSNCSS